MLSFLYLLDLQVHQYLNSWVSLISLAIVFGVVAIPFEMVFMINEFYLA